MDDRQHTAKRTSSGRKTAATRSGYSVSAVFMFGLPVAIATGLLLAWFFMRTESRHLRHHSRVSEANEESTGGKHVVTAGKGMLRLMATPPGVEAIIDGKSRGRVQASGDHPWQSKTFLLPGLAAGRHHVSVKYGLAESEPKELDIVAGETVNCKRELWLPNCIVQCKDGATHFGMVRDMTSNAIRLAISPTEDLLLAMDKVKTYRMTPPVVLRGNDGVTVRQAESDTPELVIDPFPERKTPEDERE